MEVGQAGLPVFLSMADWQIKTEDNGSLPDYIRSQSLETATANGQQDHAMPCLRLPDDDQLRSDEPGLSVLVQPLQMSRLVDAIFAGDFKTISQIICDIEQSDEGFRQHMADLGGPEPIVSMLADTDLPLPVRRAAAQGIFDDNTCSQIEYEDLDICIREKELELVLCQLRDVSPDSRKGPLLALWAICKGNSDLSQRVCQLGGLQLLVSSLQSEAASCQETAALVITTMCLADEGIARHVQDSGGTRLLATLLRSSSPACRENVMASAAALLVLCKTLCHSDDALRLELARDMLPLLLSHLKSSSATCRALAARAMARISSSPQAAEHLVQLGAMMQLITLLSSSSLSCSHVHQAATEAIAQMLIPLLSSAFSRCQAAAAAALGAMCQDAQISSRMVQLGGLQPLTSLLTSSSAECREQATAAMGSISYHIAFKDHLEQ
ncbi:hypothetical protein WJX74_002826 [Apatococcus lobatus]|uniref:Armadillo repeat-containing protein 6 n=1 Tax=Apatococcus lobatus TaxID=904363 RepID=A0AAW1QTW4_9CHLO